MKNARKILARLEAAAQGHVGHAQFTLCAQHRGSCIDAAGVTDSIAGMEAILTACGNPANLGINMDTGNSWLGGADPVAYVRHFGSKIKHVHWKDLPSEMESQRGRVFGCGMAVIPLGTGAIDISGVHEALRSVGFAGHTTLEIAGDAAVLASRDYLRSLEREYATAAHP